jgi:starch phosphorylase
VLDLISNGFFSHGDPEQFRPLVESLLTFDPYMLMADYESYVEAQDDVGQAYQDAEHWTRMSIINVARMGRFSSDRAVREYCRDIWHVGPLQVDGLADSEPQESLSGVAPSTVRAGMPGGMGRKMH